MKKHLTLIVISLFAQVHRVGAQDEFGNVPEEVMASDATITKMGHLTMTMGKEVVVNPQSQQTDTIVIVRKLDWGTESGTAQKRIAQRRGARKSYFENPDDDWWLDMWWFTYTYPSVNADGEPVTLSAMACMPDEDCKFTNGLHLYQPVTTATMSDGGVGVT